MKQRTLSDLFIDQVRDLYDAERQLVKALPKMAKAADSDELRKGFEKHLRETEGQVARLEKVLDLLDHKPKGKSCEAMKGLVKEAKEIIDLKAEPEVLDAGLIAAAQKVEHYEIAGYGTLCTWAEQLGLREAQQLLHQTLEEEKKTDETLTRLAKESINARATDRSNTETGQFGNPKDRQQRQEEVEAHANAEAETASV